MPGTKRRDTVSAGAPLSGISGFVGPDRALLATPAGAAFEAEAIDTGADAVAETALKLLDVSVICAQLQLSATVRFRQDRRRFLPTFHAFRQTRF